MEEKPIIPAGSSGKGGPPAGSERMRERNTLFNVREGQ